LKHLLTVLAVLILCSDAGVVEKSSAATDEQMRFVVVRSSQAGCEPKCAEWISAEGRIVLSTAEQFAKVLRSLGGRKLPILVHSRGGLLGQAMDVGYLIRARGLDVAVARTVFDLCVNVPSGCKQGAWSGPIGELDSQSAFCYSACTFILAGGVRRFVAPEARVGVHNFVIDATLVEKIRRTYLGKVPIETVFQNSVRPPTTNKLRSYITKMGISDDLIALMESTSAHDVRILTETELQKLRLATEVQDARALVYQ
jgi:hypothetical protein